MPTVAVHNSHHILFSRILPINGLCFYGLCRQCGSIVIVAPVLGGLECVRALCWKAAALYPVLGGPEVVRVVLNSSRNGLAQMPARRSLFPQASPINGRC